MPNFRFLGLAIAEAALVILITQLTIWIRMILYALGDSDATFSGTISAVYGQFEPGDVLSFAAGILGSSTAYSMMKIGTFRTRPALTLVLVVAPLVVFFFSMPVFIQDLDGQIENPQFASFYVAGLLVCSALLWLHALYQSRAFFEVSPSDQRSAQDIVNQIEREAS